MKNNKIGIISNSLNGNKTGVGQYLYHVLKCFIKIDNGNEYVLLNYKDNPSDLNLKIRKVDNCLYKYFSLESIHPWHLLIPLKTRKDSFDLVFSPAHIPTFFSFSCAYVLTVCDIIPILFPRTCWFGKNIYYRLTLGKTLKSADRIIAISENTKNDLIKHFHVPADKISVVYLGVSNSYKRLSEEETKKIRKKYNLNFPLILHVGDLDWRKNILGLVEAFYSVKKKNMPHKLVLTGRRVPKEVSGMIKSLNLEKDVLFTGYVPDEDLPGLYNTADLFVYPSIYEGFGLPPLEAMACGTPVITSNTSSFPEIVQNSGIMVDPHDVDGLSNRMLEVLKNENLRKDLSEKGLIRAKQFSWEKCAEEILKIFDNVISNKK